YTRVTRFCFSSDLLGGGSFSIRDRRRYGDAASGDQSLASSCGWGRAFRFQLSLCATYLWTRVVFQSMALFLSRPEPEPACLRHQSAAFIARTGHSSSSALGLGLLDLCNSHHFDDLDFRRLAVSQSRAYVGRGRGLCGHVRGAFSEAYGVAVFSERLCLRGIR